MKKWLDYLQTFGVIILVLLALSMFVLATNEETPVDPITQEVTTLQKELTLDTSQLIKVREILEKKHQQATQDREQYKLYALQLIESARARREQANKAILTILTPPQQDTFTRIQKWTPIDRELNMWTEGLLLNDDQAFTIEGILIDFYNKIEDMMPEGMPTMEGEKPDMGNRPPQSSDRGMGPRGFGGAGGLMREAQSEKISKIKKLLSSEQINLFKQILDDLKKKMKERRHPRS